MGATKRSILIMFCALILFRHVEASSSLLQLYEVSSPANFSGVGVSLLRLRAHSLWKNGASLSSIGIPPKAALPFPFTRRVDLVYQDLGNWSTSYYNIVINYSLVAPVVGLMAYDPDTGPTSTRLVGLEMRGDSVITCLSKSGCTCVWWSDGHFSIVAPPLDMKKDKKGKESAVKWWMIGIPGGGILCRWRSVRKMERIAERSEGLNSIRTCGFDLTVHD
ncbi:hypothetical protein SASPL_145626 [Salvia splendens]|uniref:Uncharacterized protein n=1 Tax=Salvia splendens TaxID=180675 RepID=A0A8X8WHW4_SALSN|nr:hypothetical protein SASPL_145626 [Salvia splendens]